MSKKKDDDALFQAIEELDLSKLDNGAVTVVSTGFLQLDAIFGRGGLAVGKIYEVAGEPGTWKSVFLYKLIAQAQKAFPAKKAYLFDTEMVVQTKEDLEWIQSHGVDISPDRFAVIRGMVLEDMFNKMLEVASDENTCFIGLDSLGNMANVVNASAKRFERDDKNKIKDDRLGMFAKATGSAVQLLATAVARNHILMVVVNQVRDNVSMYGGGAFVTPGGKKYKHNLSGRIEFYRKEILKKGDEIMGAVIKAVVARSKISAAGQTDESNHLKFFSKGAEFQEAYNLFDEAVQAGIMIKSGAWIKCEKLDRKWQGQDKVYAELESSEELREELRKLIDESN